MATVWELEIRNVLRFQVGTENVLVVKAFIPYVGSNYLAIQWVKGTLSPTAKMAGCQYDHWPPSSAEAENDWSCTSTSSYDLMACTGTTANF